MDDPVIDYWSDKVDNYITLPDGTFRTVRAQRITPLPRAQDGKRGQHDFDALTHMFWSSERRIKTCKLHPILLLTLCSNFANSPVSS